jgi:hypothetical protein
MTDINQMVIRSGLRDMFNKGYLSISTIKECLKLAKITPVGSTLDQLSVLHCVHFKDMDRELAEQIPAMVAGLFDGMQPSVDDLFAKPAPAKRTEVIDITPVPEKRGLLRLLGVKS